MSEEHKGYTWPIKESVSTEPTWPQRWPFGAMKVTHAISIWPWGQFQQKGTSHRFLSWCSMQALMNCSLLSNKGEVYSPFYPGRGGALRWEILAMWESQWSAGFPTAQSDEEKLTKSPRTPSVLNRGICHFGCIMPRHTKQVYSK